jgi:hypothetical protein
MRINRLTASVCRAGRKDRFLEKTKQKTFDDFGFGLP